MQRPLLASLIVSLLATAVLLSGIGCGGGGGSGGSDGGGTNGGNPSGVAVLKLVATPQGSTVPRSLGNTVEGEVLTIQALSVDQSGVGTLVPVTSVRSAVPRSVAAITGNTLTAVGAAPQDYTVTANASGKTITALLHVYAAGTRKTVGGVVRTSAATGVAGATVRFFSPGDSQPSALAYVGPDGQFSANIPTDATQFSVDTSEIRDAAGAELYYSTYMLGDLNYDDNLSCYPALTGSGIPADAVFILKSSGTIPPPPTGCGA